MGLLVFFQLTFWLMRPLNLLLLGLLYSLALSLQYSLLNLSSSS